MGSTLKLSRSIEGRDRPGTPTVLVHGVGSEKADWDGVVRALGDSSPIVSYDLRGHGDSPRMEGPWDLDDFVADHMDLMRELGIESSNLVGSSLGGLIAQAVALAHPESVERLVVLSAVAGRTAEERRAVLDRLDAIESDGVEGVAERSVQRWYTAEFRDRHPDAVSRRMRQFAANDRASYTAAYRVLATSDLADELSGIQAPTLVMTGSDDVGSPPRMSRLMAERIPDSRLVIIDGVKHAILHECPERVAAEIMSFLSPGDPGHPGAQSDGMSVRRAVLSDSYVDNALSRRDAVSVEFQDFITKYCWDEVWTDRRLSRREHSLLTLAMTAALGRMAEFEAHTVGALRNGLRPDELAAVLRQITVYCGVPAGVGAAGAIRKVLGDDHERRTDVLPTS